jgi:hypothetical protein
MSSVGREHPDMQRILDCLQESYGVRFRLKEHPVEVCSWGRLAREFNFSGCELLIVDTEGYDVKILRSLIAHCQAREYYNEDAWPYVIQFETQSHSDKVEGFGAEWGIIAQLEKNGYTLVRYSHYDSQLARSDALRYNPLIKNWAMEWVCVNCKQWNRFPYVTRQEDWLLYCQYCCDKITRESAMEQIPLCHSPGLSSARSNSKAESFIPGFGGSVVAAAREGHGD